MRNVPDNIFSICPPKHTIKGGGIEKKSLVPAYSFFIGGTPGGGGGGGRKKFARNFFLVMKFPQLYPTSLGLEGARRIFFKVTIDVSADMGGICVSGHKDPWDPGLVVVPSCWHPLAVQGLGPFQTT